MRRFRSIRILAVSGFLSILATMSAWSNRTSAQADAVVKDSAATAQEIERLRLQLRNQDWHDRVEAARSLGALGPKAASAVPDLLKIVVDRHRDDIETFVVSEAYDALANIGSTASAPCLDAWKKSTGQARGELLVHLLGNLYRGDDPPLENALCDALGEKDDFVRTCAASAVTQQVPMKKALPILMRMLKEEKTDYVRSSVAMSLGRYGQGARSSLPLLTSLLTDRKQSENLRIGATRGIAGIGITSDALSDMFRRIAKDESEDDEIRGEAVGALLDSPKYADGAMGDFRALLVKNGGNGFLGNQLVRVMAERNAGKEAIPILLKILANVSDRGEVQSTQILQALSNIGPEVRKSAPMIATQIRSLDLRHDLSDAVNGDSAVWSATLQRLLGREETLALLHELDDPELYPGVGEAIRSLERK
jgi:HEAT repeat protein